MPTDLIFVSSSLNMSKGSEIEAFLEDPDVPNVSEETTPPTIPEKAAVRGVGHRTIASKSGSKRTPQRGRIMVI